MWLWFVEKGWLYCMLIMGVVLTVQLIIHWKDWTFLRKMGAFTVIVLVFHVMEEWVMPVVSTIITTFPRTQFSGIAIL